MQSCIEFVLQHIFLGLGNFFGKSFKYSDSEVWETFLLFKFRQPVVYLRNYSLTRRKKNCSFLHITDTLKACTVLKASLVTFSTVPATDLVKQSCDFFLPVFHFITVWQRILCLCSGWRKLTN